MGERWHYSSNYVASILPQKYGLYKATNGMYAVAKINLTWKFKKKTVKRHVMQNVQLKKEVLFSDW